MEGIRKCIYMLISPSKKCYIGFTTNFKKRLQTHSRAPGNCPAIHNAIRKYGWENLLKVVVEIFDDDVTVEFLKERETYWIAKHKTLYPKGYNLTTGGDGGDMSEESRQKMRKAKIGNQFNLGRIHTEETKSKISKGNKRYYENLSDEEKKKRSRKHTLEELEKMSIVCGEYYKNMTEEQKALHKERSYQKNESSDKFYENGKGALENTTSRHFKNKVCCTLYDKSTVEAHIIHLHEEGRWFCVTFDTWWDQF